MEKLGSNLDYRVVNAYKMSKEQRYNVRLRDRVETPAGNILYRLTSSHIVHTYTNLILSARVNFFLALNNSRNEYHLFSSLSPDSTKDSEEQFTLYLFLRNVVYVNEKLQKKN